MSANDSGDTFDFSYNNVLEFARKFDTYNATKPQNQKLAVGLIGFEIWKFAQALKHELLGESSPRRRASDQPIEAQLAAEKRIKELEAEVAALKANALLNAGVAFKNPEALEKSL
jgi:hypothetical protein